MSEPADGRPSDPIALRPAQQGYDRAGVGRRLAAVLIALITLTLAGWLLRSAPPGVAVAGSGGEAPRVSDPTPGEVPTAGSGRDPLTPTEVALATRIATDPALSGQARDVTGAAGPELLSVELADPSGADRRHADVLLYDYATDQLVKRVIDVPGGRVEATFAATRMQPPATARETEAALALLLADPAAELLRQRFRTATGTEFTSPGQLSIEAQVFVAQGGGPKARGGAAADACGEHRCLMLLPLPAGQPYLDLTDVVVDLSGRTVVRLG
ncbi:hypothetical protein ABTW72_30040 [Micromonospora sp. NPDC127501]|uniref:hypothetical protein n=1 Tax=Micromonospora sp. NPDC127501 TaxID=3154872 RepID=UPI00332E8A0F